MLTSYRKTDTQNVRVSANRGYDPRFMLVLLLLLGHATFTKAQNVNLDQVRNGTAASPISPGAWVNGNVNASQAHMVEGYSVPYRMVISGLSAGTHVLDIEWDTKASGKNALDYITQFNRIEPHLVQFGHSAEVIDPLIGTGLSSPSVSLYAIPEPTQTMMIGTHAQPQSSFEALPAGKRVMTLYNGVITNMQYLAQDNIANAQASSSIRITFTCTSGTVVFAWGGHIASQHDWGAGMAAGGINGSPYHMRLKGLDGSGGNMDRSLQAAAVVPPSCLISGTNPACPGTVTTYSAPYGQYYSYQWTILNNTSGASIVGASNAQMVTINAGTQAGSYDLQISVDNTVDTSSCSITVAVSAADANAGPDKVLTCSATSVQLNGSSTSTGASYAWTAFNGGHIASGANTATPTVDAAGSYALLVTSTAGCTARDTAVVTGNTVQPTAVAGTADALTCHVPTTQLNGSSNIDNAQYLWTASNGGHILSGAATATPVVDAAGTYTMKVTNPANGCFATDAVAVTHVTPMDIFVGADGPLTFCEGGSVTISASEADGYLWSNGEVGSSITVNQSGSYSVTVTDFYGCTSAHGAFVVAVNNLPTVSVSANGPLSFCPGGSVTLTASGASTYVWSNGATGSSIVVSAAGSYSVIGTNVNGCTDASDITSVSIYDLPVVAIAANGPTQFCQGGSVQLCASGASVYHWSNGANTQCITVNATGDYAVTGTNVHGCTAAAAPQHVTVNPLPTVSIAANGPTTFCQGGAVQLSASGASSYLWSNGATTASINVSASGSFSVVGTNAFGCTSAAGPVQVVVNPLPVVTVSANGPTTFCFGGSVVLTASGGSASYLWNNGATTQAITVYHSGSYSVIGTTVNGCSAASASVVAVEQPQSEVNVAADGPTTFCQGGSVIIGASEADSYLWSNGAFTGSIEVSAPGSYSVTVVDFNGCTAASAPVVVAVNPLPNVSIIPAGSTTVCQGNSVLLSATGASSYLWNNGATTASISVASSGNFSVIGTDANGCSNSAASMAITVKPLPMVSVSINGASSFCPGGSVNLVASGAASYHWSNGSTAASIVVAQAGAYAVTGTDVNGCTNAAASVNIVVNPAPSCSLNAPAALPGAGTSGNALSASSNIGVSYQWNVTGSGWTITGGQGTPNITYTAGSFGTVGNFSVVVTSAAGCTSSCNVAFETAPMEFCSRTQGYYGSSKGKTCNGMNAVENIQAALASGALVFGDGVRKLSVLPTEAACLNMKLPSGTTPSVLPVGNVTCATATGPVYLNNGKFANVLLGQTIALSINVRLDANLGNLAIAGPYMTTSAATNCQNGVAVPGTQQVFVIPQAVITYLGVNNKVSDLIALANKALGMTYVPAAGQPSLSQITAALDAFNKGFDGCRILNGFSQSMPSNVALKSEIDASGNGMTIGSYPNPFSATTTLEFRFDESTNAVMDVYTMTGAKVASLFSGVANAGETYTINFDANNLVSGVYLCKLSTNDKSTITKLVLIK